MRQVPVTMAWIVNAFENSSQHSDYYLDMQTGDVKFYSPLDFPEHKEITKKLDKLPDRFIKIPKLDPDLSLKIRQEFTETVEEQYLKGLLEKNVAMDYKFRIVLMEYEEPRRQWYKFQNDRYEEFLRNYFKEKGVELVERPAINALEYNKTQ